MTSPNTPPQELFDQLEHLVATNEAFMSKVVTLDNSLYKVFNYRLASYSDFLLPGARYSRGIMFEVDSSGKMIRVACSMPTKFFNYGELSDINTLAETLIKQGRLSQDVYDRTKATNTEQLNRSDQK